MSFAVHSIRRENLLLAAQLGLGCACVPVDWTAERLKHGEQPYTYLVYSGEDFSPADTGAEAVAVAVSPISVDSLLYRVPYLSQIALAAPSRPPPVSVRRVGPPSALSMLPPQPRQRPMLQARQPATSSTELRCFHPSILAILHVIRPQSLAHIPGAYIGAGIAWHAPTAIVRHRTPPARHADDSNTVSTSLKTPQAQRSQSLPMASAGGSSAGTVESSTAPSLRRGMWYASALHCHGVDVLAEPTLQPWRASVHPVNRAVRRRQASSRERNQREGTHEGAKLGQADDVEEIEDFSD